MVTGSSVFRTIIISLFLGSASALSASDSRMHQAICSKDLDTVKKLVQGGFKVNKLMTEPFKAYPLELSAYCFGGAPDILEYLMDQGADLNLHTRGSESPLMSAILKMDDLKDPMRAVVLKMIRRGARVNFQSETSGRTPLMFAAYKKDRELVKLLLDSGASRTPRSYSDWCISNLDYQCDAADHARMAGDVELALFLEGKPEASYRSTLHYAARTGNIARIKELIRSGADVNEEERLSRFTPLYYAAFSNHLEAVRILAGAGAKVDVIFWGGGTPLRDAILNYQQDMARLLIDLGATAMNKQTMGCGFGQTEFDFAIMRGYKDLAFYMIDRGAINLKQPGPAFQALIGTKALQVELARHMIKKGAQPVQDDIDHLKRVANKSEYIRNMPYNAQIIALYEEALRNPVAIIDNEGEEETDAELEINRRPPVPAEIFNVQIRSIHPVEIRNRSIHAMQEAAKKRMRSQRGLSAEVLEFDRRFRDAAGNLSPDLLQ